MHAAYYENTGPVREVLRVGELETTAQGPGEVRVRVRASRANPSDVKGRMGGKPGGVGWARFHDSGFCLSRRATSQAAPPERAR